MTKLEEIDLEDLEHVTGGVAHGALLSQHTWITGTIDPTVRTHTLGSSEASREKSRGAGDRF